MVYITNLDNMDAATKNVEYVLLGGLVGMLTASVILQGSALFEGHRYGIGQFRPCIILGCIKIYFLR